MFGIWGIEGVAFVDGEEAVSWIDDVDNGRFQGELPELALLDIRLPGEIDGASVGERLRNSKTLSDVAMVLTTAYKLTPEEEKAILIKSGADKLVYKPLPKFGELQSLLEGTIGERRAKTLAAGPANEETAQAEPEPASAKSTKSVKSTQSAETTNQEKRSAASDESPN